jgi:hypothetical protein
VSAKRRLAKRDGGEDMASEIRRIDYFYTTVPDRPGEAARLLAGLAEQGVSLLAFAAVPVGPATTQLTVFPADDLALGEAARKANLRLDGPHPAIMVQGDDELGALAAVHEKIAAANVNVFAASGVADGRGGFGYLIYVKPEDYETAAQALEV